ncbi:hypothetical protein KIPB_004706 [Kipferlia bialata]|uniref:Uncharacterized protein n=1 Tax=Kipferlia bialata TaxID=797122 RepID=A0A391NVU8_9EUKA|nr:hypothetical protein KIPB_004706 [Kipferlia bialata]|eukprot:g4706.t1
MSSDDDSFGDMMDDGDVVPMDAPPVREAEHVTETDLWGTSTQGTQGTQGTMMDSMQLEGDRVSQSQFPVTQVGGSLFVATGTR